MAKFEDIRLNGVSYDLGSGDTGTLKTILQNIMHILSQVAYYTTDISAVASATEALIESMDSGGSSEVTITQSGSTLIFGNVPAVTSVTQSGSTLILS